MKKKWYLLAVGIIALLAAHAQNGDSGWKKLDYSGGERMIDGSSTITEVRESSEVVKTPEAVNRNLSTGVKLLPSQNKKGKWGFVDEKGKFKVKAGYDAVSPYFLSPAQQSLAFCKKDGFYGLLDEEGDNYLGFDYLDMKIVNYSYAIAEKVGEEGVTVVVLEPTPLMTNYDEFTLVDESRYAIGKRNGKVYIVGQDGKESKDMCFDEAEEMGFGMTLVKNNEKYGVIDHNQRMIIPCKYANASFEKGCYQIGDNWDGFGIVSQGKIIVPPDCKQTVLVPFQELVAYMNESGKFNLVRFDGTMVFEDMDGIGTYDEEEGVYHANYTKCKMLYDFANERIGVENGKSVVWLPSDAKSFSFNGVVGRYLAKNGKRNYVSKNGKPMEELYGAYEVRPLNGKYLAVCTSRRITSVSTKRNSATSPAGISVSGGTGETWEVANADGKILTNKRFSYIGEFNSKGELPYEAFDKSVWGYVKGKMKFNGDKVIYLK